MWQDKHAPPGSRAAQQQLEWTEIELLVQELAVAAAGSSAEGSWHAFGWPALVETVAEHLAEPRLQRLIEQESRQSRS